MIGLRDFLAMIAFFGVAFAIEFARSGRGRRTLVCSLAATAIFAIVIAFFPRTPHFAGHPVFVAGAR